MNRSENLLSMLSEYIDILLFGFSIFDEKIDINIASKNNTSIYKTFRCPSPYLASSDPISSTKKA